MRRVSKGALAAIAAALVVAAFCLWGWLRLMEAPPVTRALPLGDAPRLMVVASDAGLTVLEPDGAWRLSRELKVRRIAWPAGLYVEQIRSVAWSDGRLAMIVSGAVGERQEREALVVLGDESATVSHFEGRLLAVRSSRGAFEVYTQIHGKEDRILRAQVEGDGVVEPLATAKHLHLDAVEGMVFVEGTPRLIVQERGAEWLVTPEGRVERMPPGARTVWSPSRLVSPARRDGRIPFLYENGQSLATVPALQYHALVVAAGKLVPLERTGCLLSTLPGANGLHARATPRVHDTFKGWPVGDHIIALGARTSQVVLLDRDGHNVAPASRAETIQVLTRGRAPLIAFRLMLLAVSVLLLPLALALAVRRLRKLEVTPPRAGEPDARGVFTGVLRVPPGTLVQSDVSGHAALPGGCQLVSNGVVLDLSNGPLRTDGRDHRDGPLLDGTPVYVVGRVETETEGGPMRASHRRRLVPDGRRYFIGRGGATDWMLDAAARENRFVATIATLQLLFGLLTLLQMGLRPFM